VKREHKLTHRESPIAVMVFCSCGWTHSEPRRNALARAAKMRAAIRRHAETIKKDEENR